MQQTLPNIYFVARQAGSAAAFTPVIKELKDSYSCHLFGYEHAFNWWENRRLNVSKVFSFDDVDFKIKPDLIVTGTSLNVEDDNQYWVYAKKRDIPSIAFVDSWVSYWERFSVKKKWDSIPENIAVIDDFMYKQLASHGAPVERLKITGSPAFESLSKEYKSMDTHQTKNKEKILFVMDPLLDLYGANTLNKIGYTEFDFLKNCLKIIQKKSYSGEIEIRLHPREVFNKYHAIIQNFSSLEITVTDHHKNKVETLNQADIVIGMNSILLYEAAILGINVWSYQINAVEISDIVKDRPFINIISKSADISLAINSKLQLQQIPQIKSSLTDLIKDKING